MLFTQVKPMLLSSQNEAFDDDDFIFEPKWDGWRILIHKQGDRMEAYTKNVLYTNKDHTHEPLMNRKSRLDDLVTRSECIMPTLSIARHGKQLKQLTIEKDLEGIVAKRRNSKYQTDTRSADWIKIKNYKLIDTVILGYRTVPHFQFVVGVHFRTVPNKPVAIVEWGIKPEEKAAFLEIAKPLHGKLEKHTQWIEPRLCCRIQYQDRTDTHHLRNTSFKGFLFDKKPQECHWTY